MTDQTYIRPAAVAGQFYADDPVQLQRHVEQLLQAYPQQGKPVRAIVAPHAGLMFSGPIAASAYVHLAAASISKPRIVIIGPAHRVYLQGLAVTGAQGWQTPLGCIGIDQELRQLCLQQAGVSIADEPHRLEHSLEVQLPFLQVLFEHFTLLPLVAGDTGAETIANLLEVLWHQPDTLFVISSDLSHFHDYETANRIDSETVNAISALSPAGLQPEQACGCRPLNGLMDFARRHGHSLELLDRRNSGDTAGAHDRVVGYSAFALH